MTGPEPSATDLAKQILDRPARLGAVRLVVVDGPSGSGKTTFADRLADAVAAEGLAVAVVHTDDLVAGWEDQFGFRYRLDRWVLEPLRAGRPARYRVYDWVRGRFGEERTLPVPEVFIVEGSTTTGAVPRAELTLSVFLDAPHEQRLARVLARDGAGIEAPLRRWMAAEQAWFAMQRPAEWVDHRIDATTAPGAPSRENIQHLGPGDGHG